MAQNLANHLPIQAVGTISGNQEKIQNFLEASGNTFYAGTPVTLGAVTAGFVGVYSGTPTYGTISSPGNILGITMLPGKNLATNGAGASPAFGSIGFPGGAGAVATVPNQPSAYNIYHGAPFIDGYSMVQLASLDTIFEAQVDASSGGTYNATTALIGTQVGLTADGNGTWYADLAKVTPGTNSVAVIVSLNPLDMVVGSTTSQVNNGRIRFVFVQSVIQITN